MNSSTNFASATNIRAHFHSFLYAGEYIYGAGPPFYAICDAFGRLVWPAGPHGLDCNLLCFCQTAHTRIPDVTGWDVAQLSQPRCPPGPALSWNKEFSIRACQHECSSEELKHVQDFVSLERDCELVGANFDRN